MYLGTLSALTLKPLEATELPEFHTLFFKVWFWDLGLITLVPI